MKQKILIVIPTFGNYEYVNDCLKSIKATVSLKNYELLFAIAQDNPNLTEKELEEFLKIKVEHGSQLYLYNNTSDSPQGFAKNCNKALGSDKLNEDYFVLFLNDDTISRNNFLFHMIKVMEKDKTIGAVGAKLLYKDNTIQFGGHVRNPFSPKWFDHKYRFQPSDSPQANIEREVISLTGACFLTNTRILKEVSKKFGHYGFDEKYPMAFEDVDLSFKIRLLGYKCWFQPKAEVYHLEGGTRGKGEEALKDPKQKESIKQFWNSWDEDTVDMLSKDGYNF